MIKTIEEYNKAKAELKDWDSSEEQGIVHDYCIQLSRDLLQYRRENNIFEVGDLVVITDDCYDKEAKLRIFNIFAINTIDRVAHISVDYVSDDNKNVHYGISGEWFEHMRHATDAEIKAGHRL